MRFVEASSPGDAEVLRVGERAEPVAREDEVVINVEAAGICRADVLQRRGLYPPPPGASDILGLEVAGTVAAIGRNVTDWSVGDRVCALTNGGGYAEYVAVPHGQVLPIPEGWTSIEAASLPENVFTVWENLFNRARVAAGETLLVHGGSSGIGTIAIMLARAFGVRPYATAGSDDKCAFCVSLGAEFAVNYKNADFVAVVQQRTNGRGVDVILDMVGGEYIARDLAALAIDGRIACIASWGGATATIEMGTLIGKCATVMGSALRPRTAEKKAAIAEELRSKVWPLLPLRDPIRPIVDSVFPFARASEAHRRIEASTHIGKVVLTPNSSQRSSVTG